MRFALAPGAVQFIVRPQAVKLAIQIVWVAIAAVLSIGSFAGGDTSIGCGWLFLIWTAPFGIAWWFWLYWLVDPQGSRENIQYIGTAAADIAAFAFWFYLVPAAIKRARAASKGRHAV